MNLVIDWQDQFLGEELWMHVGDLLVMSLGSRHIWLNCILHVNKCFNVDTGVL